jgi:hypothetical protein
MAFLADELDPLVDELDNGLNGINGINGLGEHLDMDMGMHGGLGMSLADELDAGPEDLGAVGGKLRSPTTELS